MGLFDDAEKLEGDKNQMDQGGQSDMNNAQQNTNQGGGFAQTAEDGIVNQEVDKEAQEHGVPNAFDGEINKELDQEVNKF